MKKKGSNLKSSHLLVILTFVCIAMILLTVTDKVSVVPVRNAAGAVIVPIQNAVNKAGSKLTDLWQSHESVKQLRQDKKDLEEQIAVLQEENTKLTEDTKDLEDLQNLYDLDKSYSSYEKIGADVIAKDAGNWFSTFTINKGKDDGVDVDMNVISDGGLVGIVTQAGSHWATVRSIIDDASNVSAQLLTTSDNCIVSGDLTLIEDGKLAISELYTESDIAAGEKVVTSDISEKYLPGILIGYVDSLSEDSNHLTKNGYLIPAVDFTHISHVLVIKQVKETYGDESGVDNGADE